MEWHLNGVFYAIHTSDFGFGEFLKKMKFSRQMYQISTFRSLDSWNFYYEDDLIKS